MTNVVKLLDRARKMCSPRTDYQVAKRLGIEPTTIYRCRHRGGTLDNMACWKLAKMLGLPITDVIAYMEEDRARDEKKKAFWRAQLPRILPPISIATAVICTAVIGALIGGTAETNNLYIRPIAHNVSIVKLLCRILRLLRRNNQHSATTRTARASRNGCFGARTPARALLCHANKLTRRAFPRQVPPRTTAALAPSVRVNFGRASPTLRVRYRAAPLFRPYSRFATPT